MTRTPPARPLKPVVLELPPEACRAGSRPGMYELHLHRPGKPRVYRLLKNGLIRRRVHDDEAATLQDIAVQFGRYVDEHRRQRERATFRIGARLAAWIGRARRGVVLGLRFLAEIMVTGFRPGPRED